MTPSSAPSAPRRLRFGRWPSLLIALALGSAAACGGGGDDAPGPTPPTPTPGTLAVALSGFPASVVAGSQSTVGIAITRGGSFTGAVTLAVEGAPAGVTASLSATSLPAGATTATLTLQVGTTVAAGSYPITVRATGTGVSAATATSTLLVTAAPVPSFTLTAEPTALSVVAGQQGTSTLTVVRSGGFTGGVQLALENAPSGVTGSFSANPVAAASSVLTLAVGASTVPGTYPITVRGTGVGVAERTATVTLTVTAPAPTPTLTIASASSAVSVAQGQSSASIAITITRGGGLTGDAALVLEGAPTGVTGVFTPNPATAATAQLVLSVGTTVPAGSYPLTVRGTVGSTSATATIALTVSAAAPGDFSLTIAPTSATVTAGQSTSSTVSVTRTNGFAGTVNLTATGAPSGVTVSFAPAAATGAQATMSVSTTAGTAPGTYPITVRGNATGLQERSATFTLTVQAGGGGGTGNVTWQFCDTDRFPLWFGYRDGASGAWTRVLPGANQTYRFTINGAVGAVTYVLQDGAGAFDVETFLQTRTELQLLALAECEDNPIGKTHTGTVAGLGAGQSAIVTMGATAAIVGANGAFTISNVDDGLTDLLAARSTIDLAAFSTVPDRFILRRNLNLPNNGAIGALDFGSAEAFAPATAAYTFANAGTGELFVTSGFSTSNGIAGFFTFGPLVGGTSTRTVYGIPAARTQAGDLHYVLGGSRSASGDTRLVAQYNRDLTDRTLTFGPALSSPNVTGVASAPYRRWRVTGPWQAEYDQGISVTFSQFAGAGRIWTVLASRGYAAGSSYELEIPDLSAVAGFNATWGLLSGPATEWQLSGSKIENAPFGPPTENFRLRAASREGNAP